MVVSRGVSVDDPSFVGDSVCGQFGSVEYPSGINLCQLGCQLCVRLSSNGKHIQNSYAPKKRVTSPREPPLSNLHWPTYRVCPPVFHQLWASGCDGPPRGRRDWMSPRPKQKNATARASRRLPATAAPPLGCCTRYPSVSPATRAPWCLTSPSVRAPWPLTVSPAARVSCCGAASGCHRAQPPDKNKNESVRARRCLAAMATPHPVAVQSARQRLPWSGHRGVRLSLRYGRPGFRW